MVVSDKIGKHKVRDFRVHERNSLLWSFVSGEPAQSVTRRTSDTHPPKEMKNKINLCALKIPLFIR